MNDIRLTYGNGDRAVEINISAQCVCDACASPDKEKTCGKSSRCASGTCSLLRIMPEIVFKKAVNAPEKYDLQTDSPKLVRNIKRLDSLRKIITDYLPGTGVCVNFDDVDGFMFTDPLFEISIKDKLYANALYFSETNDILEHIAKGAHIEQTVYVYKEFCDENAYGEEMIEIHRSKEAAVKRLRERVSNAYGNIPFDDIPNAIGLDENDTFTDEYVSIGNGDGAVSFWVIEQTQVIQ